MKTSTKKGLKTTKPTLDFTCDTDSAVLGESEVELVWTRHVRTEGGREARQKKLSGRARVTLDLNRSPGIRAHGVFEGDEAGTAVMAHLDPEAVMSLLGADGESMRGWVQEASFKSETNTLNLIWRLTPEPVCVTGGDESRMVSARAHAFNLKSQWGSPWGSLDEPLVLEHNPWKVRVNRLEKSAKAEPRELQDGDCEMTHVLALDQSGDEFSGKDAIGLLNGINSFFAFASGAEHCLACPSGQNAAGMEIWTRWSSPRAWRRRHFCWFDGLHMKPLAEAFPGFMHRWTDKRERRALAYAIWWYVQANASTARNQQGIVAAQIALETLSHGFVPKDYWQTGDREDGGECEVKSRRKRPRTADWIRALMEQLRIPATIPDTTDTLKSASDKQGWDDIPHALAEVRNMLVHGRDNGWDPEGTGYFDTWKLAMQTVELVILALCGFNGQFRSRMTRYLEQVPWAD